MILFITGYPTNPTLADTDDDGLADNLELGGWEVYSITRSGDSSTWEVDSDPTKRYTFDTDLDDYEKYANILDPWTGDTDLDSLSDISIARQHLRHYPVLGLAEVLDCGGLRDAKLVGQRLRVGLDHHVPLLVREARYYVEVD